MGIAKREMQKRMKTTGELWMVVFREQLCAMDGGFVKVGGECLLVRMVRLVRRCELLEARKKGRRGLMVGGEVVGTKDPD